MKQFKILTLSAVALMLGLTSCNNDNTQGRDEVKEAIINLEIKGSAPTRAVGATTDADDSQINELGVFVFTGSADTDVCISKFHVPAPLTNNKTGDLTTTNEASTVFVVANVGNITTNHLKDIATVADLKAALVDYGATTSAQASGNVMMTSGSLVGLSAFAGTPEKATASATLQFVGSKMVLTWKEGSSFTNTSGEWKFDIFVNQANAFSNIYGTIEERATVAPTKGYYSAIATTDNPATTTNILNTSLLDLDVAKETEAYYYVFGNDGADKATIVGIRASHTTEDPRYFAVHFNGVDANGHTIVPGKAYQVNISINGDFDAISGGGEEPGTEEPELGAEANIEVEIIPAEWGFRVEIDKDL